MTRKIDILYKLLSELHDICAANGINYALHNSSAVAAALQGEISENQSQVDIIMTHGDSEKLYSIISAMIAQGKLEHRYIEGLISNPRCNANYMAYGDDRTLQLSMLEFDPFRASNFENNCIHIDIRFIEQSKVPTPKQNKELKFWKAYHRDLKTETFSSQKRKIQLARTFAKFVGKNRFEQKRYKLSRSITGIDGWDHISDYSIVSIGGKKYPSEIFAKLKETKIVLPGSSESIKVNILDKFDEYGKFLFGEDWAEHVETKSTVLVSTILSFNEFKQSDEYISLSKELTKFRESIKGTLRDNNYSNNTIKKIRQITLMSKDKIQYTDFCNERYDEITALNENQNYEKLELLLTPLLTSLINYSKNDITYSIDEEIDAITDKLLILQGHKKEVDKIAELRTKEYFL